MSDRLERLTNLIAVLLDTRKPLVLEEIVEKVPGYPPERESYRRQFERDKATLREVGIPISLEAVHAFEQEMGYRIRRADYQLPPLDLTDEERLALHLAVTAVRLEGDDGGRAKDALQKLGALEGSGVAPLAALPTVPAMPFLFDAMRRRAPVTFGYRGETRHLHPYGPAVAQRPLVRDRLGPGPGRRPVVPGRPDRFGPRSRAARHVRASGELRPPRRACASIRGASVMRSPSRSASWSTPSRPDG